MVQDHGLRSSQTRVHRKQVSEFTSADPPNPVRARPRCNKTCLFSTAWATSSNNIPAVSAETVLTSKPTAAIPRQPHLPFWHRSLPDHPSIRISLSECSHVSQDKTAGSVCTELGLVFPLHDGERAQYVVGVIT